MCQNTTSESTNRYKRNSFVYKSNILSTLKANCASVKTNPYISGQESLEVTEED